MGPQSRVSRPLASPVQQTPAGTPRPPHQLRSCTRAGKCSLDPACRSGGRAGGGGGCCSASLPGSEQSDLQSGGQVCVGGALPAPRIGAEQGRTLLCKVMAGGGWRAPRFPTLPSRPEALCTHPFHYNFSFKNRGEAHVAVSRQSAASRSEPRAGVSRSLGAPCGLGNVEAAVSKRSCHRDLLGTRRSP